MEQTSERVDIGRGGGDPSALEELRGEERGPRPESGHRFGRIDLRPRRHDVGVGDERKLEEPDRALGLLRASLGGFAADAVEGDSAVDESEPMELRHGPGDGEHD